MKYILNEKKLNTIIKNTLLEIFDKNDIYNQVELVDDPNVRSGKEWAEKGGNFPIKRNGKIYYISRSVAISLYCYCQNPKGEWCILANKRGTGCQNNVGLWNVICGYLDYGRDAESQAALEAYEETGVIVPKNKIIQQGINTRNLSGAQNVTIRFAAVLDGTTDNYPLSSEHSEQNEVADIKWILLSEVTKYNWAYGQKHKVIEQAKTSLNYENGVIYNNIDAKINSLKNELKNNPYAFQLFNQILKELKK